MKAAILLGFFDLVLVRMHKEHASRLQDQSLVWIGVLRPHGDADLKNFKGLLFHRLAAGADVVLVLAVIKRGQEEDIGHRIDEICGWARDGYPNARITVEKFRYALEEDGVIDRLASFFEIAEAQEHFPDSLDDIEGWCETNFSAKLILHPRAVDAAKKSQYEDVSLIYKCLRMLATEYRDNRLSGGPKTQSKLKRQLSKLGISLSPSISLAGAKQYGDDYFIHYPTPTNAENREFLGLHLKKGVAHEERYCLRIYFFWDEDNKRAVVGWLPSHLGTRDS